MHGMLGVQVVDHDEDDEVYLEEKDRDDVLWYSYRSLLAAGRTAVVTVVLVLVRYEGRRFRFLFLEEEKKIPTMAVHIIIALLFQRPPNCVSV